MASLDDMHFALIDYLTEVASDTSRDDKVRMEAIDRIIAYKGVDARIDNYYPNPLDGAPSLTVTIHDKWNSDEQGQ